MSDQKKVIIVGGVAGGASAAARLRRLDENAQITIFERGQFISFANCGLPYHISGEIADRDALLLQTPEAMKARFNVDIKTFCEVIKIDKANHLVEVENLKTGENFTQQYDKLILSPGASPVIPPIEGVDNPKVFTLRNIADMDSIIEAADSAKLKRAVVVGGGYIGLEMVEALVKKGFSTSLVELAEQVFAPVDMEMTADINQELKFNKVDLKLKTSVDKITSQDSQLVANLSSGEQIACDFIILAIGVKPENSLAKDANLELGKTGGIAVSANMQTSDSDIYAVGDAIEVQDFITNSGALFPLAGPANRQGRIAADNICGLDSKYKNTQGTAICKVFDLAVGMTGLSEKAAKRAGISYEKIYLHPSDHAGYYPNAVPLNMKLLFEQKTGKILGAQIVASAGVDKRIDVFATAIRANMTVFDLEELELSYAPPFGSAKDPVNLAGFIASNYLRGQVGICHYEDIQALSETQKVLDVRKPAELASGKIDGSINIELDKLRENLDQLDKNIEYLVHCRSGQRSYVACNILQQHGFKCKNLTGGYLTYQSFEALEKGGVANENSNSQGETMANDKKAEPDQSQIDLEIDACGLQCPGPIMKVREGIETLSQGQVMRVTTTDRGFIGDIPAWCESTGNQLITTESAGAGKYQAIIKKSGENVSSPAQGQSCALNATQGKTMVVFSGDFDKAMASFIIANGAAATGSPVTMFFTFWGLNVLRKESHVDVKKNFIEKMFGWMMPKGPKKLKLSNMNMLGAGRKMIDGIMKKKNVSTLPELIQAAQAANVRLVACAMSMDLMGLKQEELIDGVEIGGVAMYLNQANQSNVNLFI